MRKMFLVMAIVVAASVFAQDVSAQQKSFYVAGNATYEKMMRPEILPEFEKKHNVKVEWFPGNSTDTLARLRAKQQVHVALMDDGPTFQAVALGLCGKLKPETTADLYPLAKIQDSAVGIGFVAAGIGYNRKMFEEKKWPPPSSWHDLENPKFKKLIAIPGIDNTYGLDTLVMLARLHGGGENNIDPGFKAMKELVAPNVLVFESSSGKLSELFQHGDIAMGVWGSGPFFKVLEETGFPIAFVTPKEGGVTLLACACTVAGNDMPDIAEDFIRTLLAVKLQTELASKYEFGPTNSKIQLPPDVAKRVIYGPEAVASLVSLDWSVMNVRRAEWTERWQREIER